MDMCDVCGFDFGAVDRDDVEPRVTAASGAIGLVLTGEPDRSMVRPEVGRWSMTEYGAHVRDVLLTIRDRMVIGLVEDNPGFKSLYRDERVDRGLYAADTPAAIAPELEAATAMFVRLFNAIDPDALSRQVQYGYPKPQPRTILWMGLQAIHESEHHLDDIRENLTQLRAGEG